MSKQLTISSALSVLVMAVYALFGPHAFDAPAAAMDPISQAHAAPAAPFVR
ncbi:MAG: hypothetical protein AB7F98_17570 [Novosphingobium sp.]